MTLPRPAAGFTGTLELPHGASAIYEDTCVRVTAPHDEELVIPIPIGSDLETCVAVMKDGSELRHRWSPDASGALVMVPANTGPVREIRIGWKKA